MLRHHPRTAAAATLLLTALVTGSCGILSSDDDNDELRLKIVNLSTTDLVFSAFEAVAFQQMDDPPEILEVSEVADRLVAAGDSTVIGPDRVVPTFVTGNDLVLLLYAVEGGTAELISTNTLTAAQLRIGDETRVVVQNLDPEPVLLEEASAAYIRRY